MCQYIRIRLVGLEESLPHNIDMQEYVMMKIDSKGKLIITFGKRVKKNLYRGKDQI